MSTQIPNAFVQQYNNAAIMLAQQKGSRLRHTVMAKDVTGKACFFDRVGPIEAVERTSRHALVSYTDTPHSRRKVTLRDWEVADLIDEQDTAKMLIDFKPIYAQNIANGMGRKMDKLIINAFEAAATSVDSADSSSSVVFATGNIVDEDFGTANSDLTVAKIIEARKLLLASDVDEDDGFYLVHDSMALSFLLNEATFASHDYNEVRTLMSGNASNPYLGFNFIRSQQLNSNSEGFLNCLAYTGSAMGLAIGMEMKTRMDVIPERSHATQVLGKFSAESTRVEEEKAVIIQAYRA